MRASPRSRPRTKPPQERRVDLMNAAERLFLRNGVEPTTVEEITNAADVAKGTFYLHFSSKEEIRIALGDRFAQQLLMKVRSAVGRREGADWGGKLAAWAGACVAGYLDSIELHDILFYSSRPPAREGLVDNVVIDFLIELLRTGVEAEAWSVGDARSTAVFMFSGLHAVVDDAYSKEKRINRARLSNSVELLCRRAVGLSP
jgi:AcrR family transcriptional regulator